MLERFPPGGVLHDAALDVVEADTFDPRRGALEIASLLAVELQEGRAVFEHLDLGSDLAQEVGGANFDAAVAPDMQLPTTFYSAPARARTSSPCDRAHSARKASTFSGQSRTMSGP